MSISTNANLCYGVCLSNDDYEDLDLYEDIVLKIEEKLSPNSDVVFLAHCMWDEPMWIVAIKETLTTASRGYPEQIKSLTVDDSWNDVLKAFIKEHSLKTNGEFGWWLSSMWS